MEAWQERVIEEKKELDAKIVKLVSFMYGEARSCDPGVDYDLLRSQLQSMLDYSDVLGRRIYLFSPD